MVEQLDTHLASLRAKVQTQRTFFRHIRTTKSTLGIYIMYLIYIQIYSMYIEQKLVMLLALDGFLVHRVYTTYLVDLLTFICTRYEYYNSTCIALNVFVKQVGNSQWKRKK